jgi:hypothetical protein
MTGFEIKFYQGRTWLVHRECGTAFPITEGDTLSTLMDWTIAHRCEL